MAVEENRVSFSSNGSGVSLHTKFSNVHFSTEEYTYYESLFKIADHHNDGALSIHSSSVITLLLRTEIPWKDILAAVKLVSEVLPSTSSTPPSSSPTFASILKTGLPGGNPSMSSLDSAVGKSLSFQQSMLKFHHWLLLCKLLACYKQRRENLNACLNVIDRSEAELRFKLSRNISKFLEGECFKVYRAEVGGWKSYGEDYQSHHVKYNITTLTTLINKTSIEVSPFASSSSSTSASSASIVSVPERVVVERRYSEFETLVIVLRKTYPGRVVPPLPLKDSRYLTPVESIATRRQHELQLFLDDLNHHPTLKLSFAVGVFLESSSNGLRAFYDLYSHMNEGRLEYTKSKDDSEGVVKMLSDGASLISNSVSVLSAHAKSFEFVSSIWGAVTKSVATITAPFTTSPDHSLEDKARFFETIERCAKNFEQVLQAEAGYIEETTRLAECLKNMADLVWAPDLAKTLLIMHSALDATSQSEKAQHDAITVRISIPINYLGRYTDSFRAVIQQRSQAQDARASADRQEQEAKKVVDHLTAQHVVVQDVDKVNAAKVKLGEMERIHEKRIHEEERINRAIHEEHRRLHTGHRNSILGHLKGFAEARLKEAQSAVQHWESFQQNLQSSS